MRKIIILLIAMFMIIGFTAQSNATLTVVGSGYMVGDNTQTPYQLIYDSALNVTWLDYTYLTRTSTWQNAANWAANLIVNYNGRNFTGWTLPSTTDGSAVFSYNGTGNAGYNIKNIGTEMSYLYTVELGNKGYYNTAGSPQQGYGLQNTGPFVNLLDTTYWYSTAYSANSADSWYFDFSSGLQYDGRKSANEGALAVYSGNIAAVTPVPIPGTLGLLCLGLTGLAASGKIFRQRNG